MEIVAKIECAKCKTSLLMKVVKPGEGEASIRITATNVLMPCGHHGSDPKRWTGDVAALAFEVEG